MTAYAANKTGNWSDTTMWTPNGLPGDGDTVTIGAFTCTVDIDVTIGTSPNNNTTKVLDKTSATGSLIVASGVTLTIKGNRGGVNNAVFQQNAGSTVRFDASSSGGTPVYTDVNVGFQGYVFNGTQSQPCVIEAVAGRTFALNVNWSSVTATHTTFRRASTLSANSISGNVSITNCTFDNCNRLSISSTTATLSIAIADCKDIAPTHATDSLNLSVSTAPSGGSRRVERNVFQKGITYNAKAFLIRNNVILGGLLPVAGSTWSMRENFIEQSGLLNGGNGQLLPDSSYRNYWVVKNTTGNPHFIAPTALAGADNFVQQNIFESQASDLVDVGDCVLLNNAACSGGNKIHVRNNIALKTGVTGESVSSGCLLTMFNATAAAVGRFDRNTANVNNSNLVGTIGRRGAFAFAEGNTGFAGQVETLRSNIAFGDSANQGYLGERVTGNVKDIVTAANANRNWTHNVSAGDNQRSYEDKAASNTLWTAGDAVAASVDINQGGGDPQFVDAARNVAAWCASRGYGAATYVAGVTALSADPTRAKDLIRYVFEGMKPRNASMRTAAHDGGCVGAANFERARSVGQVSAHNANVTSKFGPML